MCFVNLLKIKDNGSTEKDKIEEVKRNENNEKRERLKSIDTFRG